MAQVAVQINGKTFRMACDEGQEAHLMGLARQLDESIDRLRGEVGEIGDQRLTVMAGVMMADQLSESQARVRVLEADIKDLKAAAAGRTAPAPAALDNAAAQEIGHALDRSAQTVERIAEKLKGVPPA